MPVRSTMVDMILQVRDLIGDNPPTGATQWTDQQIQDALDRERLDVNISDWRELLPYYSVVSGAWQWTEYYDPSNYGDWEPTVTVLYNAGLTQLSPSTADLLTGHWSFGVVNQSPPVFVVGRSYDVYGAAALIVERWLGREATSFDFSIDRGLSYTVSQKRQGLQMLLAELRAEARPRTAHLVRRDAFGVIAY
jgi:hypothetical protein